VRLAEEPDQVEEGLNREMAERRKSTEQAADPIAALLRMGILQRIRYVLEVERSPQVKFTRSSYSQLSRDTARGQLVQLRDARVYSLFSCLE